MVSKQPGTFVRDRKQRHEADRGTACKCRQPLIGIPVQVWQHGKHLVEVDGAVQTEGEREIIAENEAEPCAAGFRVRYQHMVN